MIHARYATLNSLPVLHGIFGCWIDKGVVDLGSNSSSNDGTTNGDGTVSNVESAAQ